MSFFNLLTHSSAYSVQCILHTYGKQIIRFLDNCHCFIGFSLINALISFWICMSKIVYVGSIGCYEDLYISEMHKSLNNHHSNYFISSQHISGLLSRQINGALLVYDCSTSSIKSKMSFSISADESSRMCLKWNFHGENTNLHNTNARTLVLVPYPFKKTVR